MNRLFVARAGAIAAGVAAFAVAYFGAGIFVWSAMHQGWPAWTIYALMITPPVLGLLTGWWLYPDGRDYATRR